jgi:hypothetical protein
VSKGLAGATLDFYLAERRNVKAAKRFLGAARSSGRPRSRPTINCSTTFFTRIDRFSEVGKFPCPVLAENAPVRTTKVVLAAAHLDHDPGHCGRRHRNVSRHRPARFSGG